MTICTVVGLVRDVVLISVGAITPLVVEGIWDFFELFSKNPTKKSQHVLVNWILIATFAPSAYSLWVFSEENFGTILLSIEIMSSIWLVASFGCGVIITIEHRGPVESQCFLRQHSYQALLMLIVGFTSQIFELAFIFHSAVSIQLISNILLCCTCVQICLIIIGVVRQASELSPDESYMTWYFLILMARNTVQLAINSGSLQLSYVKFVTYSVYLQAAFVIAVIILPQRQFNLKFFTSILQSVDDKVSFIRYVSHELRTPLNIIQLSLGFVKKETMGLRSVVGDGALAPISDAIADINDSCDTATSILDDLLTLDKMQGNKLVMEREEVVAVEYLQQSFRQFSTVAQQNKVTFTFHVEELDEEDPWTLNFRVALDRQKFGQVLRNLLSNAFKFTPAGGNVTMQISREFSECSSVALKSTSKVLPLRGASPLQAPSALLINLIDTGAGISKENQAQLFGQYVQFNASVLQKGKGSGLGLWISRGIVELHGGKLTAASEGEGKGCTFSIRIPLTVSPQESSIGLPHSPANAIGASHLQVLQVGQPPSWHSSRVASRRGSKDIGPMDIRHLNVQDGKSEENSTRELQTFSSRSASRRVIGPIMIDSDAEVLGEEAVGSSPSLVTRKAPVDPGKVALTEGCLVKYHYFIVDDSKASRKAVNRMLTGDGHSVTQAADGKAFLDMMKANGGRLKKEVHVVLIDNNMPVMSGVEATRLLRTGGYMGLVIGLTGDAEVEGIQQFISNGADHVLVKPLNLSYLNFLASDWWTSKGSPDEWAKHLDMQSSEFVPTGTVHLQDMVVDLEAASTTEWLNSAVCLTVVDGSSHIAPSKSAAWMPTGATESEVRRASTAIPMRDTDPMEPPRLALLELPSVVPQSSSEWATGSRAIYAIIGVDDTHNLSLVAALRSAGHIVGSFANIADFKRQLLQVDEHALKSGGEIASDRGSDTDSLIPNTKDFATSVTSTQFSLLMVLLDAGESSVHEMPSGHLQEFLDENKVRGMVVAMVHPSSADSPGLLFPTSGKEKLMALTKPVHISSVERLFFDLVTSTNPATEGEAILPNQQPMSRSDPSSSVSMASSNNPQPSVRMVGRANNRPWLQGRRLHFLVVDDSPTNRKVLCRLLANEGHVTSQASDGLEFLKLMEASISKSKTASKESSMSRSAHESNLPIMQFNEDHLAKKSASVRETSSAITSEYDVVLMDHLMPRMNGSEATHEIRQRGYTGLIVGLTGHTVASDVKHFLQNGVNHVLFKPLKVKELKEIVIAHFEGDTE